MQGWLILGAFTALFVWIVWMNTHEIKWSGYAIFKVLGHAVALVIEIAGYLWFGTVMVLIAISNLSWDAPNPLSPSGMVSNAVWGLIVIPGVGLIFLGRKLRGKED